MIVLQIIGGIVLFIIAAIFGLYIYLRIKIGKFLGTDIESEPLKIHLTEDLAPEWLSKEAVKNAIEALKRLGYVGGKAYTIDEKPEFLMYSMLKDRRVSAAVCFHDTVGCWIDVFAISEDGTEYTYSNAPYGSQIKCRPECKRYYDKAATPENLDQGIQDALRNSGSSFKDIDVEDFRELAEQIYKKDIMFKHQNGGLSYEEFINTAKKEGQFKTKESDNREAYIQLKEDELRTWREAALDEYRERENIDVEKFYDMEHELLIVPFKTSAEAFLRHLNQWEFIADKNLEPYSKRFQNEEDTQAMFEKINNSRSPSLRAKLLTDFDFPLPLKIYTLNQRES